MNLVKISINLDKYEGNTKKHVHGIAESISSASKLTDVEIKISQSSGVKLYNSECLLKILGDHLPTYVAPRRNSQPSFTIKVIDLMRDCVGINRTYSEIYKTNEHFYKYQMFSVFQSAINYTSVQK